jgi:hypothetical protein
MKASSGGTGICNRRKKREESPADDELHLVARQILAEAKKRARFEIECLTQMVLQEAKAISRYSKSKPFYIS